ncbi:MAG: TetR/AcrR family transcriptional regulator, partial [Actinomycetota bacterium]|nr:TetR/AcrR family transcriptional regulator [Actinomycetota bacterium]
MTATTPDVTTVVPGVPDVRPDVPDVRPDVPDVRPGVPDVRPDVEAHRGPGRPRSAQLDRAICRAAIDLLAEESYDALSIEAVAARAGCGKAAIYRRWPSKSALVVDAIATCKEQTFQLPDTGSARDDLLVYVRSMVRYLRTSDVGRVMPALVAELARNPELAACFREEFVKPRRAMIHETLTRGIARGELRADIDLDLVADAMVAVFH